jgi:hypothetical protein
LPCTTISPRDQLCISITNVRRRDHDHDHYPFGVVTLTLPQHLAVVPNTTRANKPTEKVRIGEHAMAFTAGEKVEAAEVARTAAPSEKGGGHTHVCLGNGISSI